MLKLIKKDDREDKSFTSRLEELINKHEAFFVVLMMLISSGILSHSFFSSYPLHTTTDEVGAIVGAAALAGYDWSGVIEKSGYYGFGYYALFAPLFKMRLSPILIYRIILVITRIIRGSVISGIAYYIGRKYFKFESKIFLIQISVLCTIPLHHNDDANIINDVILDIMLWIVILLVCKLAEYIKSAGKVIGLLVLWCLAAAYVSMLHTRALVIVIASFLVIIALLFYEKKKKLLLAVSMVVPVVLLAKEIVSKYQTWIWSATGSGLRNASVKVTTELNLLDLTTWEIWFDMLIGHISVQTLLTGGLFLLAIVSCVKYIFLIIFKRQNSEALYVNIVLAISVLCVGAVFAAFAVSSWFTRMYSTWNTEDMEKVYSYKALCYVRYWNVFAMPFLYTGVYLAEKIKKNSEIIRVTIGVGIILLIGFISIIIPIVKNNSNAGSYLYSYLTYRGEERVTEQFYYKCILFCMCFVLLALFIYFKKKNSCWAIFPILMLMVVGYNNANVNYNEYVKERISSMVLASYEQKCVLEQEGSDIGQIYAYDERDKDENWKIFSVLQFYFYEYRIEDKYPTSIDTDDIIITYARSEQIEKDFPQLECYQLDDNEVWYTNIELVGYAPIER